MKNSLSFAPNFKPKFSELLIASIIILLVIIVNFYDSILFINSHFIGGGSRDAGLYIWLTQISFKSLLELSWFNTNAFYPYTKTLAWSDNYIFPGYIYFIFKNLGLSLPFIYNFSILLAKFLQGFFMYKLSFLIRGNHLSSLVAAVAFTNLSYFTNQVGHPQLQWLFFIPLSFYLFFKLLNSNSLFYGIIFALTIALNFLTSVYIALFTIYGIMFFGLFLFVQKRNKEILVKYAYITSYSIFGIMLLFPFLFPYFDIRGLFGEKHLYEAKAFCLTIVNYFQAGKYNFTYGNLFSGAHEEKAVFSGFLLLLSMPLILKFLYSAKNIRKRFNYFILLLLTFVIISLFGNNESNELILIWLTLILLLLAAFEVGDNEKLYGFKVISNTNIALSIIGTIFVFFSFSLGPLAHIDDSIFPPSPYSVSYYFIPGFSALRASARFTFIIYFLMALSFSISLPPILKKIEHKKTVVSIFILLLIIENYNFKYPLEPLTEKPHIFNDIKLKSTESLLVLPFTTKGVKENGPISFGDFALKNVNYMNWSSSSNYKIVNGYSGQRSHIINKYPYKLRNFPDKESIIALSEIVNLRRILVLKNYIKDENHFLKKLKKYSNVLSIKSEKNGDYLLSFNPIVTIKNKNDYKLRVPSYPGGGKVTLQVKNIYQAKTIDVFIEPYSLKKSVNKLALVNSKGLQEVSFFAPNTIDTVRPRLFRFEANNNLPFIVSKITYTPAKNEK